MKMKKSFAPPSTSPVDDQDTPQPNKQTPKRPIIPQLRINQDTTLGSRSSSDSSSSLHHNEHMAKTRHDEVEDLLPQKRRNPNINTEVNSILATAASKEELNSPASDLLQMTASKAPRTLSPTAKPRSNELVGSQFPQAAMPGDPNPRDATSSNADLPEQDPHK